MSAIPTTLRANPKTGMNVVMTEHGGFIEVQGTAEVGPYSRDEMAAIPGLTEQGIEGILAAQKAVLA